MDSRANEPIGSAFCVVVHDVTAFFAVEIERLLDDLQPLVGNDLVGAVVPQWHGKMATACERKRYQEWSLRFGDFILHGWTHCRAAKRGIISWCTGAADEFGGLSLDTALERLRHGRILAEDLLARPLNGFVPPAWRLAADLSALRTAGIDYLMRFGSLVSYNKPPVPLATWSWDWGWLPGTRLPGAALGTWQKWWHWQAVPTVVLHPFDVRRGHAARAVRLIRQFLTQGLSPVLPRDLIGQHDVGLST